jgi:hypothetical protein
MKTPEDVVRAVFDAMNLSDWAGMAALFDEVSLRAFKHEQLDDYDHPLEFELELDEYMESHPGITELEAKERIARLEHITSVAHRLNRDFLVIKSVDELREMDAGRVFALYVQANAPHRRMELEPDDGQPWEKEAEWEPANGNENRKQTRAYRHSVIGHILDGENIAHVLYRDEHTVAKIFPEEYGEWLNGRPEDERLLAAELHHRSTPHFATCRRQADGTWRMIAEYHFMPVPTLEYADEA